MGSAVRLTEAQLRGIVNEELNLLDEASPPPLPSIDSVIDAAIDRVKRMVWLPMGASSEAADRAADELRSAWAKVAAGVNHDVEEGYFEGVESVRDDDAESGPRGTLRSLGVA